MQSAHLRFGSTKMHIMRLSREHVKLPSGARRDRKEFLVAYLRFQVGNLETLQLLRPYKSMRKLVLMNSGTGVPSGSVSEAQVYGGPPLYIKMSAVFCQILDHNFKKEFAFRYAHDAGEFFLVLKFDGLPRLLEVIGNEFKTEEMKFEGGLDSLR
jgi:hypothetical protein